MVGASTIGTIVEWYDFYLDGNGLGMIHIPDSYDVIRVIFNDWVHCFSFQRYGNTTSLYETGTARQHGIVRASRPALQDANRHR